MKRMLLVLVSLFALSAGATETILVEGSVPENASIGLAGVQYKVLYDDTSRLITFKGKGDTSADNCNVIFHAISVEDDAKKSVTGYNGNCGHDPRDGDILMTDAGDGWLGFSINAADYTPNLGMFLTVVLRQDDARNLERFFGIDSMMAPNDWARFDGSWANRIKIVIPTGIKVVIAAVPNPICLDPTLQISLSTSTADPPGGTFTWSAVEKPEDAHDPTFAPNGSTDAGTTAMTVNMPGVYRVKVSYKLGSATAQDTTQPFTIVAILPILYKPAAAAVAFQATPNPLYVILGDKITFLAPIDPPGARFPWAMPEWQLNQNPIACGSAETTVEFKEPSTILPYYKTVSAKAGYEQKVSVVVNDWNVVETQNSLRPSQVQMPIVQKRGGLNFDAVFGRMGDIVKELPAQIVKGDLGPAEYIADKIRELTGDLAKSRYAVLMSWTTRADGVVTFTAQIPTATVPSGTIDGYILEHLTAYASTESFGRKTQIGHISSPTQTDKVRFKDGMTITWEPEGDYGDQELVFNGGSHGSISRSVSVNPLEPPPFVRNGVITLLLGSHEEEALAMALGPQGYWEPEEYAANAAKVAGQKALLTAFAKLVALVPGGGVPLSARIEKLTREYVSWARDEIMAHMDADYSACASMIHAAEMLPEAAPLGAAEDYDAATDAKKVWREYQLIEITLKQL